MEVRGQIHAPAFLSPGNRPSAHLTRGCVGLRLGMENYLTAENLLPLLPFERLTVQSVAGL